MNPFTQQEMDRLTPEQRETVALVQLKLVQNRQDLLDTARGKLAFKIIPVAIFLVHILAILLKLEGRELILFCSILLFLVIQMHALFLNSRMNALVELLGEDLNRAVLLKPSEIP